MSSDPSSRLDALLTIWPIASTLASHLPAGDLINLARTSTGLRAALHTWEEPEGYVLPNDPSYVRLSLQIGRHQTAQWKQLKERSKFLCSSWTHTKGGQPRPCRLCSRPICEACIVRASFKSNPKVNTFKNRCRALCKPCWAAGTPTKGRKFPISEDVRRNSHRGWFDPENQSNEFCSCTLKNDGWLCLECKEHQNTQAESSASKICFGERCSAVLEADFERRKICLWCDNPLSRSRVTGETRHLWNQMLIDTRTREAESRRADMEEYYRKRQKAMRMSKRELRGSEAVETDPDADRAQFVRHLDTVNYQRFMNRSDAPDGDLVYSSKMGKWRYSSPFLLRFREVCQMVPVPPNLRKATAIVGQPLGRTNFEKWIQEKEKSTRLIPVDAEASNQWMRLQATILEMYVVRKQSVPLIQRLLREEHDFCPSQESISLHLTKWGAFGDIDEYIKDGSQSSCLNHRTTDDKIPSTMVEENESSEEEQMWRSRSASDEDEELEDDSTGEEHGRPAPADSPFVLIARPEEAEPGYDKMEDDFMLQGSPKTLAKSNSKSKEREDGYGDWSLDDLVDESDEDMIAYPVPQRRSEMERQSWPESDIDAPERGRTRTQPTSEAAHRGNPPPYYHQQEDEEDGFTSI